MKISELKEIIREQVRMLTELKVVKPSKLKKGKKYQLAADRGYEEVTIMSIEKYGGGLDYEVVVKFEDGETDEVELEKDDEVFFESVRLEENLPEMMLVLDFFADDQPNDDAATMKALKALPNFNKIKKEMKFMLSVDFEEDDYDWDELATEYADLICDGFEQLFSKMGVEGEAEMTGDEMIEVNVHNPINAKNVKFFKSLGFEEF